MGRATNAERLPCMLKKQTGDSLWLPEVFSTVDTGEELAAPADSHMFIYLSFFQ